MDEWTFYSCIIVPFCWAKLKRSFEQSVAWELFSLRGYVCDLLCFVGAGDISFAEISILLMWKAPEVKILKQKPWNASLFRVDTPTSLLKVKRAYWSQQSIEENQNFHSFHSILFQREQLLSLYLSQLYNFAIKR